MGVILVAAVASIVLSKLILVKSLRVDEERATVFLSFEGQPECGAVLEYVNPEDLEAGDVVSGDPAPCESRNLIFMVLQVLVVIGAVGAVLWVVWTWLGSRDSDVKAPGPS